MFTEEWLARWFFEMTIKVTLIPQPQVREEFEMQVEVEDVKEEDCKNEDEVNLIDNMINKSIEKFTAQRYSIGCVLI